MPITLDNTQLRIERSIYEVIRLLLVGQGYLPDVTDTGTYPNTPTGQAAFQGALAAIRNAKDFATEVLGHGSSLKKGAKAVPRIAIIPRRLMPGDIGPNINLATGPDPNDPDNVLSFKQSFDSGNLHIDISLVSGSAEQDRFLHAIIQQCIGQRNFLPVYDSDSDETFFMRQFNYYDVPDSPEGIEEKIYSYEIPDLYLSEPTTQNVVPISQITVETTYLELQSKLARDGTIIGPYISGEGLFIDLSGIQYKLPA